MTLSTTFRAAAFGLATLAGVKKVNDDRTRSNQVKKRGLQVVNEYFEPDFNAA